MMQRYVALLSVHIAWRCFQHAPCCLSQVSARRVRSELRLFFKNILTNSNMTWATYTIQRSDTPNKQSHVQTAHSIAGWTNHLGLKGSLHLFGSDDVSKFGVRTSASNEE